MSAAVLGVERSFTGRRWRSRLADERAALGLAQRLDLPEVVGRVLAARGVDAETAEDFLKPTLRRLLPDPSLLADMDVAVARLTRALEGGERIAIFGDYDVDGATAAALLSRYFAALGAEAMIYVPDRRREGYGPNGPALRDLKARGAALAITVDCGIGAHDALASAAEVGLDVIVVDHHMAEPSLPPATAVIDPNRLDDTSGCGVLAAVGVAFLLVVALNRELRRRGRFAAGGEPDPRHWLDLVALGTVCDMVPLTGLNRALVTQGLKVMAARRNPGLAALADVARIDDRPGAYHAGFLLGPRINAGGRVGAADLGARLLTTDDDQEAQTLAHRLDALNRERQAIEKTVEAAALAVVGESPSEPIVFVAGEGWHAGVVGIVASRLVERYRRPAFVLARDGAVAKGSARSVPGVDVGAAVIAARQAGLLINGGGHPAAAGLTVASEKLDALAAFLGQRLAPALAARPPAGLGIDGAIAVGAAQPDLVARLAGIGPFGIGNAEPRFALAGARVVGAEVVGDRHVRCLLTDGGGARLGAIAFRATDGPLGPGLLNAAGRTLHLAGHLRLDRWRGRERVQLVIDDAAPAASDPS